MPDAASQPVVGGLPSGWAQSTYDPEAFAAEQRRFAHVWTFLGLAADVAREGDWFRAAIGVRSVFVQRINGQLRGFENRCAHRFFPLRVTDKGNGPIVCGFHHWRYDGDGRAQGIPACKDVFGVVSRELDIGLTPVELGVCGSLIFGRFPSPGATESLEDFLGSCFPVLAALSRTALSPHHFSGPVEAHWKLCMHVAVDDYHLAAVHPTTFGKGGVYLDRDRLTYTRVGAHSIYQNIPGPDALANLIAAMANGSAIDNHYIVVHLMPGFVLSNAFIWDGYFACALTHFAPINHHRSLQRVWIYPSPLPRGTSRIPGGRLLDPFILRAAFHYGRHILGEDARAAERLQTNASTFIKSPLIGRLEERVQWYEEAYREIMAPESRMQDGTSRRDNQ